MNDLLDYSCISLFMGFLQDDIRFFLYAVPARALSGLSKGLVRPCPGYQSATHMALCESLQGNVGLREPKGFGEGIMSLSRFPRSFSESPGTQHVCCHFPCSLFMARSGLVDVRSCACHL